MFMFIFSLYNYKFAETYGFDRFPCSEYSQEIIKKAVVSEKIPTQCKNLKYCSRHLIQ